MISIAPACTALALATASLCAAAPQRPLDLSYRPVAGRVVGHRVAVVMRGERSPSSSRAVPLVLARGFGLSLEGRVRTRVLEPGASGGACRLLQTAETRAAGDAPAAQTRAMALRLAPSRPVRLDGQGDAASGIFPAFDGTEAVALPALPGRPVLSAAWRDERAHVLPNGARVILRSVSHFLGVAQYDGESVARIGTTYSAGTTEGPSNEHPYETLSAEGQSVRYCSLATGILRWEKARLRWVARYGNPCKGFGQAAYEVTSEVRQVEAEEPAPPEAWAAGASPRLPGGTPASRVPAAGVAPGGLPVVTIKPAPALAPRPAMPPSPVQPLLRLLSPRPGDLVGGECVVCAEVPADGSVRFVAITLNGRPMAMMNARPLRFRIAPAELRAGRHVVGVEAYGAAHSPVARALVSIRVARRAPR